MNNELNIQNALNYKSNTYIPQKVKNNIIALVFTNEGWFVEVSDGYESDYFSTKKAAKARLNEIKKEILNGYW